MRFFEGRVSRFAIFLAISRERAPRHQTLRSSHTRSCKIRWRRAAQAGNCQVLCVLSCCTSQLSIRTPTTPSLRPPPSLGLGHVLSRLERHPHALLPQVKTTVGHKIFVSAKGSLGSLASMIRKMVIQMMVKCVTMDEDICCPCSLWQLLANSPWPVTHEGTGWHNLAPISVYSPCLSGLNN